MLWQLLILYGSMFAHNSRLADVDYIWYWNLHCWEAKFTYRVLNVIKLNSISVPSAGKCLKGAKLCR